MMEMQAVVVRRKWAAADGIAAFELARPNAISMPEFTPGAHITVQVSPLGQPALLRTYSLCNAPGELDCYVLGVKRDPASRGGSAAMHDAVKVGDMLEISAPQNHFPLSGQASSHLLLGAGIGITPLLSMTQHLEARSQEFTLHYFARGLEHVAFRDRLATAESAGHVHYHVGLSVEAVTEQLRAIMAAPATGSHAYACGPRQFMKAVKALGSSDWGDGRLHFEHFEAPPVAREAALDSGFEVHLVRSGLRCRVRPNETIVAAVARVGCTVEVSCEQGVCGTCLTRVFSGEPEHRDAYLTDAERAANDQMLVCVGRARSAVLKLDL